MSDHEEADLRKSRPDLAHPYAAKKCQSDETNWLDGLGRELVLAALAFILAICGSSSAMTKGRNWPKKRPRFKAALKIIGLSEEEAKIFFIREDLYKPRNKVRGRPHPVPSIFAEAINRLLAIKERKKVTTTTAGSKSTRIYEKRQYILLEQAVTRGKISRKEKRWIDSKKQKLLEECPSKEELLKRYGEWK